MLTALEIASWLDVLLRTPDVPDYPTALNGLQLASRGDVRRIACAVDYSTATVREAIRIGANMLLVHHGMFWRGAQPLRGPSYERLATLITNDVAIYSSHLPLDVHPEVGNNVLLARRLGLAPQAGFARFKNIEVGVSGSSDITTTELFASAAHLAAQFRGTAVSTPFEPARRTRRWGICTGAGADNDTIREALERGIDTMIVGEGPHHTAVTARDHDLVIIYAGHYATETLGVSALGDGLAKEFGVSSHFIDAPTGL
jgi:dinuclear metal center YbgI/SA1388 family protein